MTGRTTSRAARRVITRRARRAADDAHLTLELVAPQGTTAVAEAIRSGCDRLRHTAAAARAARNLAIERAARTRVGSAIGTYTSRVGRHAADLPLLSLPRAVLDERRGVAQLHRRAVAAPDDPGPAIRLAEALLLLERDTRYFLAFRTLWNPAAPLIAQSVKVAGALDNGRLVTPSDQMLRRAYALAVRRLRADRTDAEALHVVARVFLATKQSEYGIKPCVTAVAGSRTLATRAQILFTLSRLHHGAGDVAAARLAANQAVDLGCSLAWTVLADLPDNGAARSTARHLALYQQKLDRVEPDDEVAYYGFLRPTSGDLWRTVLRDQGTKAADSVQWLIDTFQRLQKQVGPS